MILIMLVPKSTPYLTAADRAGAAAKAVANFTKNDGDPQRGQDSRRRSPRDKEHDLAGLKFATEHTPETNSAMDEPN